MASATKNMYKQCETCKKRLQSFCISTQCANCYNHYHANCVNMKREEIENNEMWYCSYCLQSIFPFNHMDDDEDFKATFTLCQSPCPSPCPYQSPCPNNNHFLMKLEAVFRLHQFPCQSPIQCHQISVRSVSIGPPTVKNWYGRPFPSESCKSLYKITLWRLARQLWT